MINQANTIYVIQYDFTLGENITLPADCALEFDGGSIANTNGNSYTITYNNTTIKGFGNFYSNVLCSGTCANNVLYLEYYGDNLSYSLNKIFLIKFICESLNTSSCIFPLSFLKNWANNSPSIKK